MTALSSGGYDPQRSRRPVVLHDCGAKVRLGADRWGSYRDCRAEFDGARCWQVPQVPEVITSRRAQGRARRLMRAARTTR